MFSLARIVSIVLLAVSSAHSAPSPLVQRTLTAIQSDLAQLSGKIVAINSAAIFAQSNTTPVLSLAVVNAISALATAAAQGVADTIGTPAFTTAQCTQLMNAETPLIPGTLTNELPELFLARNSLAINGFLGEAFTAMSKSKTQLHAFIGNIAALCPVALQAAALQIQANTDAILANALAQL